MLHNKKFFVYFDAKISSGFVWDYIFIFIILFGQKSLFLFTEQTLANGDISYTYVPLLEGLEDQDFTGERRNCEFTTNRLSKEQILNLKKVNYLNNAIIIFRTAYQKHMLVKFCTFNPHALKSCSLSFNVIPGNSWISDRWLRIICTSGRWINEVTFELCM